MNTTLEDIKVHMLNYLNSDEFEGNNTTGLKLIIKFWENFSSDENFLYVVSGEFDGDELDLDGSRDYIFSR